MHKIMVYKIGSKRLHLLKLIGAFLLVGAALMFLSNVYQAFFLTGIIGQVNSGVSQMVTMQVNGMTFEQALKPNDLSSQLGFLMPTVAAIMFWGAIVVLGGIIYQGGSVIVPIEEEEKDLLDPLVKRKIKRKKKKKR